MEGDGTGWAGAGPHGPGGRGEEPALAPGVKDQPLTGQEVRNMAKSHSEEHSLGTGNLPCHLMCPH